MKRRILLWLLSMHLPVVLLAALMALPDLGRSAVGQQAIINEWSQGHGDRKEWVELLTIEGPLDLRGWDLGDSSAGDLVFAPHPLWEAVMTGTLIVIYNGSDRDIILPDDDSDGTDRLLVLPHSDGTYFNGGWPAFSNSDPADNPHLRDGSGQTIHDFSLFPGSGRHPEADECTYYQGETWGGVAEESQWADDAPAADATPGSGNTTANRGWIALLRGEQPPAAPDLHLEKEGPVQSTAGSAIPYRLYLRNEGLETATGVVLTDVLPAGLAFAGESSDLSFSQPAPGTLLWQVGNLAAGSTVSWTITATAGVEVYGLVTNTVQVTTLLTESEQVDNVAWAVTRVDAPDGGAPILVDAVLYDGFEYLDADEAVRLRNVGQGSVQIGGWQLSDGGSGRVTLPAGTALAPGETMWLAKNEDAFRRQFGFAPGIAFSSGWPGFANSGDEVLLLREDGAVVDGVVYKEGVGEPGWWGGPPVLPYTVRYILPEEGQLLYRRLEQASGLPVPDTNGESDWAQTRGDVINGRKVQYPGWSLEPFFFTGRVTETAGLTVAIAPDNGYEAILQEVARAQESVQVASLTFENAALADALTAAAARGISVTVLLEGDPVGGLTDQERYVCQQIEAAGGACWFMIREEDADIQDRYRYLHAKFIIVDGRRVIVSSENMSPNSLPADDKADGTWGRRGVLLITDAPGVVSRFQAIFADDFDPLGHRDLRRWEATDPLYGVPPPGFVPLTESGGTTYTVRFDRPAHFTGTFVFEVLQAPENSLRDQDGLLGLIKRAGAGDTILVEQLSERPYWGPSSSNPVADPNPRLEAYLDAARRGATVRLLLDSFFDNETSGVSNHGTCEYVRAVAAQERLRAWCELGNPAGLGIHNKMVLVELDGRGWVHVGSLNGTEQAAKGNREVAVQVQADAAYRLLVQMFYGDWPNQIFMPLLFRGTLRRSPHPLISEVLYDPFGLDASEFIEVVNPTSAVIDLSGWQIGDATDPTDFEDNRRFPDNTLLLPHSPLVIAFSAPAFREAFGVSPDFEIYPTDPLVPDLIDDPAWGDPAAWLQLGNEGDEVLLRDASGQLVDALVYGSGAYPGIIASPLVSASNHSLERYPFWWDSDDCAADFREWPLPNPGGLPVR